MKIGRINLKIITLICGFVVLILLIGTSSIAYALTEAANTQDSETWFYEGNALYALGRYEEAIKAYDKAIKINPQYVEAWNNKGSVLGGLGRFEGAIKAYDKAIEINPQYAEAWSNKGNALLSLGRFEEALTACDKAIKINPQYVEAWNNKGSVLARLGRFEEAIIAYNKAIEINPQHADAWSNKGNVLFSLERFEEAIIAYDKAIEINPQHINAWGNKGNALSGLKRFEEALIAYDKAIEINPQYAEAWSNQCGALSGLGRFEEALVACDNAIEINPQYGGAWSNKGIALSSLGRFEEALIAHDKAIEINPQDSKTWFNKGLTLYNLGRYEETIVAYNKAMEISPRMFEGLENKLEIIETLVNINILKNEQIAKPDIYVEPSTGQITNQLILNIHPLLDTNSVGNKFKSIKLNYVFEGINRTNWFYLLNNSYYVENNIKVDLNQNNEYPFEDYYATIIISTNETNESFFENSTYENLTINSWGETRLLTIHREGNEIKITMVRANKELSIMLYSFGFVILFLYLIAYLLSPYRPDIFADFQSFSFVFFVTFVIAGIRDHLLNSYGILFLVLIIGFILIVIIKRIKHSKNPESKTEHEILMDDLKIMIMQNDEKLTDLIESLKDDVESLKTKEVDAESINTNNLNGHNK